MPRHIPRSYEEITRSTVVDPDSSFRPTIEQERAALEGKPALTPAEQDLYDRVDEVLRSSGIDVSRIAIEVDGTSVTLRGRVPEYHLLPKIENAVRSIEDVGDIMDFVCIDSGAV